MRILAAVVVSALSVNAVRADGLLYKLPGDGAGVLYDMKMTMERDGRKESAGGSLRTASVGSETVDGQKCRWIEIKMVMKRNDTERPSVAKVLVPEVHLKAGEDPLEHLKRGYVKFGDRDAKELKDVTGRDGGPLPLFLSAPLSEAKKFAPKDVKTGLGDFKAGGVTGKRKLVQGKDTIDAELTIYRHDKGPFGVVAADMTLKNSRGGEVRETITLELRATKVVKDAKTELPDSK